MRRANTFDIRPLSHCERLALIELLDSSAACINEINYDRRQAYFEARYDLPDGYTVCKLPRPTRSLPPCGGWSLLEGGAFPQHNCAPRPRVVRESDALSSSRKARSAFRTTWARPSFLLPFHGGGGGSEQCCDPRLPDPTRGLSRRFNSRCSRALSPSGERESNPFAVVVPECRTRGRCPRATGASLLVAPAVLGVCEDGSKSRDGPRGKTGCHTVKVNKDGRSSPPCRSLCSRLRKGAPRPAPLPLNAESAALHCGTAVARCRRTEPVWRQRPKAPLCSAVPLCRPSCWRGERGNNEGAVESCTQERGPVMRPMDRPSGDGGGSTRG